MRILCFGNPDLPQDSMAIRVARLLSRNDPRIEVCVSPTALFDSGHEPLCIVDVVAGLGAPAKIGIERLTQKKIVSLHDFDLGYFLQLHHKLGDLPPLTIIGVPEQGDETFLAKEVGRLIPK